MDRKNLQEERIKKELKMDDRSLKSPEVYKDQIVASPVRSFRWIQPKYLEDTSAWVLPAKHDIYWYILNHQIVAQIHFSSENICI